MRRGKLRDWGRRGSRLRCAAVGLLIVIAFGGCTRAFYRKQADKEVNDVLKEKDRYPEWKIEQYHVYADPRARFAQPSNPDRLPMPPDDDPSYKLSPHPQGPGHAGVATTEGTAYLEMMKIWDAANRAERDAARAANKEPALENATEELKAMTGTGLGAGAIQAIYDGPAAQQNSFMVKLDDAVELGLVNSREYQRVREDLYLAALPVTQQRFSFAWQWAAIEDAVRQWAGDKSLVGQQNNWNLGSSAGVSKLFSTGALLTMAFANNTVFNFLGGANGLSSTSTINVNFIQPLLQGGGKAVTLEPLTLAERNLFYSVRGYARFREEFYISIALGTVLPNTLAGAAGTGGGTVGSPISVLASLGIASTDVSGEFRGYLPSLFRELDMSVDKKYVRELERGLLLFQGFQEGGQVSPLQVDQVNSTLLQARNTVLKDTQDTTNALDQLKLQLGVPANMLLQLDDTPARPITRQLDRYYEIIHDSDLAVAALDQQETLAPAKLRPYLMRLFTKSALVRGMPFQEKVPKSWAQWAKASDAQLNERLLKLNQARRRLLDAKTDQEMKGQAFTGADRLHDTEIELDLGGLEQILRRYEAQPWAKLASENLRQQDRRKLFRLVSYAGQIMLVWARNDRIEHVGKLWPELSQARVEDLDLLNIDVDEAQERAIQLALTNRWDLMNARAQVVDAWRQLAVTANALLGVLNVQYHLDSTTPPGGTRPLAFSSAATNQELIINAQLPLVRVAQRNAYRSAIIAYERARRALIGIEDTIAAQVRFDVRQLHLFAANYKIQQKVIESLYSQVENSLEVIVAPVDPDQLKASATSGQANAAALTSQYLGALGQLNGAQTRMYDIWLSYLATRMQLYEDLERLSLNSRGAWTDEPGTASASPVPAGSAPAEPKSPAPAVLPDQAREPSEPRPLFTANPASANQRGSEIPSPRARLLPPASAPGLE